MKTSISRILHLSGSKPLAFLIFAGALVSCNGIDKNVSPEPEQQEIPTFTASTSYMETRTALDGLNIVWSADDKVAIFAGKDNQIEYKVKDGDAGKTSVTLEPTSDKAPSGKEFSANVAFYPYKSVAQCSENNGIYQFQAEFPETQTWSQNSFSSGSMPMVAVSSSVNDKKLSFINLFGLLKLKVKLDGATVKSIEVKGNAGEKLSGQAFVNCSHGSIPEISFFPAAKEKVTLTCGNGVLCNESEETVFWVAVPPCVFTKGITVSIVTTEKTIVRSVSSQVNVYRSTVLPMKEIAESLVFDEGNSTEGLGEDSEYPYPWDE